MKTFLKFILVITVTFILYCITSAQQIRIPVSKKDSTKIEPVKKDSIKLLPADQGLFFKETKEDSTKSK